MAAQRLQEALPVDTFVWDQNFTTGLEAVDSQHQMLIETFNDLSEVLQHCNATGEDAGLEQAFERMLTYAQYHFAEEELLMRSSGLDERHVRHHIQQHQQFIDQVGTMWRARAALQDPAQSFVGFLASWLGLHILGIDQSMARQLDSLAQGLSAEQAFAQEMQVHDQGTQALIRMVGRLYHVLSVQNAELARANALLEERVAQRTHELEQANIRLEAFARTDGLLQIANRGYFDDRLQATCASALRRQQPLGLLLIDVDHFKRYNDHYGHPGGDAALQALAQVLQLSVCRASDLVARLGGEEFAVLAPETDAAGATALAERVRATLRERAIAHADSPVGPLMTVSIGIALAVVDQETPSAFVQRADQALYRAKHNGRDRAFCDAVDSMLTGR